MSTENNTPQVTNDEPVVVLDDKKYVISELNQEAQYYVACLNNLGMKKWVSWAMPMGIVIMKPVGKNSQNH